MLEKTLESPLDCKEIQPVHPIGDQSWVFTGRTDAKAETPIPCSLDAMSWLIWKDSDAGRDWGQEEKGMTEDEIAGWHHRLNGQEFGWTPGIGDGRPGVLRFMGSQSRTQLRNWTELKQSNVTSFHIKKTWEYKEMVLWSYLEVWKKAVAWDYLLWKLALCEGYHWKLSLT